MKRWLAVLILLLFLPGCSGRDAELGRAIAFRDRLIKSVGCSFDAVITADYGDKIYTFSMSCVANSKGELNFTVTDPATISGITGIVSAEGGKLTFDDKALAFDILADDLITPVSAPWHLTNALRGGYLTACGKDGDYLRIAVDDSYEGDALHLDIWLDENELPLRGEIIWKERRIISLDVRNFKFM